MLVGATTVGVSEGEGVAVARSVGRGTAIDVADKVGTIVGVVSIGERHALINVTSIRIIDALCMSSLFTQVLSYGVTSCRQKGRLP